MRKDSGFTLIELFIVIALIGIMSAIAAPNFWILIADYKIKDAARQMSAAMNFAKLTAVKERSDVVIKFNTENDSYEMFVDNGDGGGTSKNHERDGEERVIKQITMPDNVDLYEASFASGVPWFRFNSRGFPNGGGHVYLQKKTVYKKNDDKKHMSVVLTFVGSSSIEKRADGTNWSKYQ